MSLEAQPDRRITLFEGQAGLILELETPEEQIAAFEVFYALAFPEDENNPYKPPAKPKDGSKDSKIDRARRMAYKAFRGPIEHDKWKQKQIQEKKPKNPRKVEAGRIGASVRYGRDFTSTDSCVEESYGEDAPVATAPKKERVSPKVEKPEVKQVIVEKVIEVPQAVKDDDFSNPYKAGNSLRNKDLTEQDKARIAKWNQTIPNAGALRKYLESNFLFATRATAITKEFCEYAYKQLAEVDSWISPKSNKPYGDIRQAIHYMVLNYTRQKKEMARFEEEEQRKDSESRKRIEKMTTSIDMRELAITAAAQRKKAEREYLAKLAAEDPNR